MMNFLTKLGEEYYKSKKDELTDSFLRTWKLFRPSIRRHKINNILDVNRKKE